MQRKLLLKWISPLCLVILIFQFFSISVVQRVSVPIYPDDCVKLYYASCIEAYRTLLTC